MNRVMVARQHRLPVFGAGALGGMMAWPTQQRLTLVPVLIRPACRDEARWWSPTCQPGDCQEHPLGCIGARLVTTLVHEMKRRRVDHGIAELCVGVGQGLATVFDA